MATDKRLRYSEKENNEKVRGKNNNNNNKIEMVRRKKGVAGFAWTFSFNHVD